MTWARPVRGGPSGFLNNPNDESTYHLFWRLRGLRGLIGAVLIGAISALNLQVGLRPS